MVKSAERFLKLKEERARRLQMTSKEERLSEITKMLDVLSGFGVENFPFVDENENTEGDERK